MPATHTADHALTLVRFVLLRRPMRTFLARTLLAILEVLVASACATHPVRPTPPVQYSCGETAILRDGSSLSVGLPDHATHLGWHDGDGDHFISSLGSSADHRAIELVMPADPRQDAAQRTYDTSTGTSPADWRLLQRTVCTARGGYTDVLSRWMKGATYDQLVVELSLGDRAAARGLVHQALESLRHRYWRER